MAGLSDPATGLPLGDPEAALAVGFAPSPAEIAAAADRMILSASGWRTVFAADGDPESTTASVSPTHLVIAAIAARTLASEVGGEKPFVVVATDTRPTGPLIAEAAIRAMLRLDCRLVYLGVAAAPEIVAYARAQPGRLGFFYVSASHNPVGHNGIKLGIGYGDAGSVPDSTPVVADVDEGREIGVAGGAVSRRVIADFRRRVADGAEVAAAVEALSTGGAAESALLSEVAARKHEAIVAYSRFCKRVISGDTPAGENGFRALCEATRERRPGVVVDFNGSARSVSVDRDFLAECGIAVHAVNDEPGQIVHQIVPEGPGLLDCMKALTAAARRESRYVLGYVPDNDGDRGNIVYTTGSGGVEQLAAQEVFALACVAELAWLRCCDHGLDGRRVAVVVNGPTSLRIERIASLFEAEVHRVEVGEANVVNRARELRGEGCVVRILGEGSNGGNITHPSTIRDPLHTLFALIKLLNCPPLESGRAPADLWAELSGVDLPRGAEMEQLVASLPAFTTTSAFAPEAAMKLTSDDHAAVKGAIESILEGRWHEKRRSLRDALGVESYRIVNYEGTATRPGRGNRTGEQRGGLKFELVDADGVARGFLWTRGSGTEPLCRIMVDVEGRASKLEAELLAWLREIVRDADSEARGNRGA